MLKVWPVDMNSKSDVEYIMDELRLNPYQRMAVLSRRRDSEAVKCRTKVVVELRKLGYSLPEIGRVMDRHHTSVLNLLRRHLSTEGRQGQCDDTIPIKDVGFICLPYSMGRTRC